MRWSPSCGRRLGGSWRTAARHGAKSDLCVIYITARVREAEAPRPVTRMRERLERRSNGGQVTRMPAAQKANLESQTLKPTINRRPACTQSAECTRSVWARICSRGKKKKADETCQNKVNGNGERMEKEKKESRKKGKIETLSSFQILKCAREGGNKTKQKKKARGNERNKSEVPHTRLFRGSRKKEQRERRLRL